MLKSVQVKGRQVTVQERAAREMVPGRDYAMKETVRGEASFSLVTFVREEAGNKVLRESDSVGQGSAFDFEFSTFKSGGRTCVGSGSTPVSFYLVVSDEEKQADHLREREKSLLRSIREKSERLSVLGGQIKALGLLAGELQANIQKDWDELHQVREEIEEPERE